MTALKLINSDKDLTEIVNEIYIEMPIKFKLWRRKSLADWCAQKIIDTLPKDGPGIQWDNMPEEHVEITENWLRCVSLDQLGLPSPLIRFLIKAILAEDLLNFHFRHFTDIEVINGYLWSRITYCGMTGTYSHSGKLFRCPY